MFGYYRVVWIFFFHYPTQLDYSLKTNVVLLKFTMPMNPINLHENSIFFYDQGRSFEFQSIDPMYKIFVEKITIFIDFSRNIHQSCTVYDEKISLEHKIVD